MRFVNTAEGGLVWPEESITGGASPDHTLLDTGWEINWPGAGHVYLSDRDLVDLVVPALERGAVVEALQANGWTSPDGTSAEVERLENELEDTRQLYAAAKAAEDGYDAALKKLTTLEVKPSHHKPAAKKPAAKD